jgi:hypothetical protein
LLAKQEDYNVFSKRIKLKEIFYGNCLFISSRSKQSITGLGAFLQLSSAEKGIRKYYIKILICNCLK